MFDWLTRRLAWVLTAVAVFLVTAPAQAKTFSVLSSKLTVPNGLMAINIDGGPGVGTFFRDTVVTLPDGTYTVTLRGGQSDFGTFTISSDDIVSTTGALYLTASDALDFDLNALTRVDLAGSTLSIPAGRATTAVPEAAGTFFGDGAMYLPETKAGRIMEVSDRSARARYGAFIVDAAGQVQIVSNPIGGADALVATGNEITFDHSQLAEINLNGQALTSPAGLQTLALPETAGTFFGGGSIFLPPSIPLFPPFTITDRAGFGTYGALEVASNLSVSVAPGGTNSADALVLSETIPSVGGRAFDVDFDNNLLATFTLDNGALSSPPNRVLAGIWESVAATGGDLTVNLPPTRSANNPYRIITRSGIGTYGHVWVNGDLTLEYDGALVPTATGFTYDACALNQLSFEPETGSQVVINFDTGFFGTNGTVVLPNGTYSVGVWNAGTTTYFSTILAGLTDSVLPDSPFASFSLETCAPPDADLDGVPDPMDNCPNTPNTDQIDQDGDGFGDVCDDDLDGDGVLNTSDNCVDLANTDQLDFDNDGVGDVCDNDDDGDSVPDDIDNCLGLANESQADSDGDGAGDDCDDDDDNDGVLDTVDNCHFAANAEQADADSDGQGDVCDGDDDNDGVGDDDDLCAATPGGALVNGDGCDGAGLIAYTCGEPEDHHNHGSYVSCVAHAANAAVSEGLMTPKDKSRFVRNAAKK